MNKLNEFIKNNFNEDTICSQINFQKKIIQMAEREIERLKSLKEKQENIPWYFWDGVKYQISTFGNYDGYRSHHNWTRHYKSYKDFVIDSLRELDPDFNISDSTDFIIYAPMGEKYHIGYEEIKEMNLIKEYFERKELNNKLKNAEQEIKDIYKDISSLENDINNVNKYNKEYIDKLIERKIIIENEKVELEKKLNISFIQYRIEEINNMLKEIDEALEE